MIDLAEVVALGHDGIVRTDESLAHEGRKRLPPPFDPATTALIADPELALCVAAPDDPHLLVHPDVEQENPSVLFEVVPLKSSERPRASTRWKYAS